MGPPPSGPDPTHSVTHSVFANPDPVQIPGHGSLPDCISGPQPPWPGTQGSPTLPLLSASTSSPTCPHYGRPAPFKLSHCTWKGPPRPACPTRPSSPCHPQSAHALSSSVQLAGFTSALTSSGDPCPAPSSFVEASPANSQYQPCVPLMGLEVMVFPSFLYPGSPAGL